MNKAQLQAAFAGKTVLLTGHTGFKGSWLLVMLRALEARVVGYALDAEQRSLFNMLDGRALVAQHVLGDVRNLPLLKELVADVQPDYVLHLAAQSLVRRSYAEPVDTFGINTMGTVHVLEALRGLKKPCAALVITTDKVYENPERGHPFLETDPMGGHDPYSASKAAAELVASSYQRSFFNPGQYGQTHQVGLATARSGNVIGGGDYAEDRLVPDFIRALEAGQPLTVRNPAATRPWQHALEPLTGYLTLAAKLLEEPTKFAKAYNFGPTPTQEATVEQLLQAAYLAWGSGTYHYQPEGAPTEPHEAGRLTLDSTRAQQELGWQSRLSWEQAVELTLDWYRKAPALPLTFTSEQVEKYWAGTTA